MGEQAVWDSGARAWHESWVKSINVETDVDRSVELPYEVDGLTDSEMSDVLLFDCFPLKIVDVSNPNISQILKR